jgi:hypothetical protein
MAPDKLGASIHQLRFPVGRQRRHEAEATGLPRLREAWCCGAGGAARLGRQ